MGILKMKKIGVEYPNLGEFCNFLGRFYTKMGYGDFPKVGLLELSDPVVCENSPFVTIKKVYMSYVTLNIILMNLSKKNTTLFNWML